MRADASICACKLAAPPRCCQVRSGDGRPDVGEFRLAPDADLIVVDSKSEPLEYFTGIREPGGIGVTPMASMVAELARQGADFTLHYCTKSRGHTAFLDDLGPLVEDKKVLLHHDGGDPA